MQAAGTLIYTGFWYAGGEKEEAGRDKEMEESYTGGTFLLTLPHRKVWDKG